jgi:hypothetical protein
MFQAAIPRVPIPSGAATAAAMKAAAEEGRGLQTKTAGTVAAARAEKAGESGETGKTAAAERRKGRPTPDEPATVCPPLQGPML